MIVSTGRRYIFVHQPKTGGTSMAAALETRAMKDDILLGDTPKAQKRRRRVKNLKARGRLWKHSTLADLDGVVSADQLDDLFVFSMTRNPWDRIVSYYHWLRTQDFPHPVVHIAKRTEFADFAVNHEVVASIKATPVRHYLTDAKGRERTDLIVRLEHLQEDAARLWDHLGFELDVPHLNSSDRGGDFRAYHTSRTRAVVANAAAEDIARFGYSFD